MVHEVVLKSLPPLLTTIIGCGKPGIEPIEQLPILRAQTDVRPTGARYRRLRLPLA
jgi:hypothetical protein